MFAVLLKITGEGNRRQVFGSKDVVGTGFLYHSVASRQRLEECAYVTGVKLIGIKSYAPPVIGRHLVPKCAKCTGTESNMERSLVTKPRNNLRVLFGQRLYGFPRAVGGTVVNDDNLVAPTTSICQRGGYDIILVLKATALGYHSLHPLVDVGIDDMTAR